jgi:muramoyltetrapeptide carboxypeptidase
MHGGNLTVLASGFGTRWQLRPKGALLFLEDVGEKGYRVDRMLNQFRQAGVLEGVNAVIFGEFLGPDQAGIEVALARFAQSIAIPVFKTNQFGHGVLNYPIRYGAVSRIERENGQVFKLVMSNS